jgi:hypothetical protein
MLTESLAVSSTQGNRRQEEHTQVGDRNAQIQHLTAKAVLIFGIVSLDEEFSCLSLEVSGDSPKTTDTLGLVARAQCPGHEDPLADRLRTTLDADERILWNPRRRDIEIGQHPLEDKVGCAVNPIEQARN